MVDVELNTNATRLAFAHRRKDVFALNQAIRGALRISGYSQDETLFQTDTGPRAFAVGDRLVFTQNDRTMDMKNGMLGVVKAIKDGKIVVIPDGQTAMSPLTQSIITALITAMPLPSINPKAQPSIMPMC